MKKILLGVLFAVFLLLNTAYLAVNSPYVVDRIARKFAPEYGFGYDRIVGNPLQGIVVDNLYYKKRKLARQIRIRINPYTLLEKRLTVSRLGLLDVDVDVLEELIADFSTPGANEESSGEEGAVPLAIAVNNIRLTLLPFERYGITVHKEELSVDSVYYDTGRFSVGNLKQVADTSLGMVELEGTYHKRFLDVEILAVEDLDLAQLEKLLMTLGPSPEDERKVDKSVGTSDPDSVIQERKEDIFLPKKIHAKKLWVTLRPYRSEPHVVLKWAQLQGRGLTIDLEHAQILEGKVDADLDTDLGEARLRLSVEGEQLTLRDGTVSSLDLEKLLTLQNGEEEKSGKVSTSKPEHTAGEQVVDSIPLVPPKIAVERLRVELKPGEVEGIAYRNSVVKLAGVTADLRDRRLAAREIAVNVDTSMMQVGLDAGVEGNEIRIHRLRVRDLNVSKLMKLSEANGADVDTPEEKGPVSVSSTKIKKRNQEVPIPSFVPPILVLERASLGVAPFEKGPLKLSGAMADLEDIRLNLRRFLLERGRVSVKASGNLAQVKITGDLKNNRLRFDENRSMIRLGKDLFERYDLPLRAEAFSPIRISGDLNRTALHIALVGKARAILAEGSSGFNVDIDHYSTRVEVDFSSGDFSVTEKAKVSMPRVPVLRIDAELKGDSRGEIGYNGVLTADRLKLDNPKIEQMLGIPRLRFHGDLHRVDAGLSAGLFSGSFVSNDMKKGLLKLGTRDSIEVARYFKLPEKLSAASVDFALETPVDFAKPFPMESQVTLRSNLANIRGVVRYDGNLSSDLTLRFPKNSLLAVFDPRLNLSAITPLKISLDKENAFWKLLLNGRKIVADLSYAPDDDRIDGNLTVAGSRIRIEGVPKQRLTATLKSPSVKKMITGLTDIYRVEVPRLDGDIMLILRVDRLSSATLELRSKQFIPDDTARIKSPVKDIFLLIGADFNRKTLLIKKYRATVAGVSFFSTKPSTLKLEKEKISLQSFWVNDTLKLQGVYDLKNAEGEITATAQRFKIDHENAKIEAGIDIKALLKGEKIDVGGTILILGGEVKYDIEAKHYATDEDIIIVQHRKKKEKSFFRKNVQLNLYVETKKPLLFKQKNVYVELRPQLSILKGYDADLQMMGSVALAKDGYYTFEDKRFVLQPSSINFTGKVTQPLLDINLVYRRYSRTIYITVTGRATEPNLNFSSDPYMTRDQILSFILFDTVDSGESAGDMLSLVGGGIAKSILGNLGLKVDTLILTQDGFEVGKKITDKVTILYDQKEENPKVIVRIQNSRRTETDISIGSESQSVDIIYKREF